MSGLSPKVLTLLPVLALFAACGGPSIDVGTAFGVAFVAPSHGATDVALDVEPTVGFNRAIDRASVEAGIHVNADGREQERVLQVEPGDKLVRILLVHRLPRATSVRIVVDAETSAADGVVLGAPVEAEFTTLE